MLPPELSKLTARFSNDQTGKVSADGLLNTLPQNRYLRHGLIGKRPTKPSPYVLSACRK